VIAQVGPMVLRHMFDVCEASLELKAAVDAHPDGIASCAGIMPGKFTHEDLLSCIEQSKRLAGRAA
jgi:hypothetical protein